ncbi:MAG: DUF1993 domain-containing protein [Acidobacteriota bacterium]
MAIYAYVLEMKKLLGHVNTWLDRAAAHAAAKKFDVNTLLQTRLAPDMFPLVRQIQTVCDQVKFAAARVAGKEPPSHPDTETTVDDLRKRIATVLAYVDSFTEEDFTGAENRKISLPRWEGKAMTARDYFIESVQPNFFFHLTMTYALLRHNGIDLGKRDYLGAMTWK